MIGKVNRQGTAFPLRKPGMNSFAQPVDCFRPEALTGRMFICKNGVLYLPIDIYIQRHGSNTRASHHMARIVNALVFRIAGSKSKLGAIRSLPCFKSLSS